MVAYYNSNQILLIIVLAVAIVNCTNYYTNQYTTEAVDPLLPTDNKFDQTLAGCNQNEYDITFTTNLATSYFSFTLTPNNTADVVAAIYPTTANTNDTYGIDATQLCNSKDGTACKTEITCQLALSNTWEVDISAAVTSQLAYNITTNTQQLNNIQTLTKDVTFKKTSMVHDRTFFPEKFDFYVVNITSPIPTGATLRIEIGGDNETEVTSVIVNYKAIADDSGACSIVSSAPPAIVPSCILTGGLYYISVLTATDNITYTITVSFDSPEITVLNTIVTSPPGVVKPILQALQKVSDIDYFSFTVQANLNLNITVQSIFGGSVSVFLQTNEIVPEGAGCPGAPLQLCDSVNLQCTRYRYPCQFSQTTYYIGVKALSLDTPNIPISYQLVLNWFSEPAAQSLTYSSSFKPFVIGESDYMMFRLSATSNRYVMIYMYVDQSTIDAASPPKMYLLNKRNAGPDDDCFAGSFASCTIENGACFIQIPKCYTAQTWYLSVYGGSVVSQMPFNPYTNGLKYTLLATSNTPNQIRVSTPTLDIVPVNGYAHYSISLSSGQKVAVHVTVTSPASSVKFFVNYGNSWAGDLCTSFQCYNNTDSALVDNANPLSYNINACSCTSYNQAYFSIFGVSGQVAANKVIDVSYAINAELDTYPRRPLTSLSLGNTRTSTIPPKQKQNFTLSLRQNNNNIINLFSVSPDASLRLTLYLGSTNLNCAQCQTSKSALLVDGKIILNLQSCEFTRSVSAYVVVESFSTERLTYTLFADSDAQVAARLSNDGVVGEIAYPDQYQHYQLQVQSLQNIVAELYVDLAQNMSLTLFMNKGDFAGASPCFNAGGSCQASTQCILLENACNVKEAATYYFSVLGSALRVPARFTLKVRATTPTIPLTEVNLPMTYQIFTEQILYHSFSFNPGDNQEQGEAFSLIISNVQGGSIAVSLANTDSQLDQCPCFEASYETSIGSGNDPVIVPLASCFGGSAVPIPYTLKITSTGATSTDLITNYVLTLRKVAKNVLALPFDTNQVGEVLNMNYIYYQVNTTQLAENVEYIVTLSNVKDGLISLYYTQLVSAEVDACGATLLCSSSSSCRSVISPCANNPRYISVAGTGETTSSLVYTLNIRTQQTQSLAIANNPFTSQQLDSNYEKVANYYSINIPAGTPANAPLTQIAISNLAGSNVMLRVARDICNSEETPTTCVPTAGQFSCVVQVPYCENSAGLWYIIVESGAAADVLTNYTLHVTQVETPAQAVTATTTPQTLSLAFNTNLQWHAVAVATGAIVPDTSRLAIVITSPNATEATNIVAYIQFNAQASLQCAMDSSALPANFRINPCCLQQGTYFVSLQYSNNANSGSNILANIEYNLEQAIVHKTLTTTPITGALGDLERLEAAFSIPSFASMSTTFTVTVDNSQNTNAAAVYLQKSSAAGKQSGQQENCFSNYVIESCAANNICYYQQIPACNAKVTSGDYYVAISDVPNYNTLYAIDSPVLHEPLQTPLTGQIKNGIYKFFNFKVDFGSSQSVLRANIKVTDVTDGVTTYNNGIVDAYINSGYVAGAELCLGNINSCFAQSGNNCTLEYNICNGYDVVTVAVKPRIIGGIPANVTYSVEVSAPVFTTTPEQLAAKAVNSENSDVQYYSYAIPAQNASRINDMFAFRISNINNTGATPISVQSANDHQLTCFNTENLCTMINSDCYVTLFGCTLVSGTNNGAEALTFTFKVSTPTIVSYNIDSIALETTIPAPIPIFNADVKITETLIKSVTITTTQQYHFYKLNFTQFSNIPNNGFTLVIQSDCGLISMYVQRGNMAGPDCFLNSACAQAPCETYTIAGCDIYSGAAYGDYYITVDTSSALDTTNPARFALFAVSNAIDYNFEVLLENQQATLQQQDTIWQYAVDSGKQFVGNLHFLLTVASDNATAPITLTANPNKPNFCGTSTLSCTVATGDSSCIIDASKFAQMETCNIIDNSFYYLSLSSSASDGLEQFLNLAAVTIVHDSPFTTEIKTWDDDDDELTQTGAGSPSLYEHYKVRVNKYTSWFLLEINVTATSLEGQSINDLNIYAAAARGASIFGPPAVYPGCITSATNQMCSTSTGSSCVFSFSTCAIPQDEVFISITSSNAPLVPYKMQITSVVEPTRMVENNVVCDSVDATTTNYYTGLFASNDDKLASVVLYAISPTTAPTTITLSASYDTPLASSKCATTSTTCSFGKNCTISFQCPITSNITFAVSSTNAAEVAIYRIKWFTTTIKSTDLVVGNETAVTPMAESEYFKVTSPQVTGNEAFAITITAESGTLSAYIAQQTLPGVGCAERSCTNQVQCSFILLCDYAPNVNYFIRVDGSIKYVIKPFKYTVATKELTANVATEATISTLSEILVFKYSVAENEALGALSLRVDGVNQGTITQWTTSGAIGDSTCAIQQSTSVVSVNRQIEDCSVTGDFYFQIAAASFADPCVDITLSIEVDVSNSVQINTTQQLTNNQMITAVAPYSSSDVTWYKTESLTFTPTSYLFIQIIGIEENIITATLVGPVDSRCKQTLSARNNYFPNCYSFTDNGVYYIQVVDVVPSSRQTEPIALSNTYSILVNMETIITSVPNTQYLFASSANLNSATSESQVIYELDQMDDDEAIAISIDLEAGSTSVSFELHDEDICQSAIQTFDCYSGTCVVPLTMQAARLRKSNYKLVVKLQSGTHGGFKWAKGAQNCSPLQSNMCSNVLTWKYGDTSAITTEATEIYNMLYAKFFCDKSTCSCGIIDRNCELALQQFACEQAARPCDFNGFRDAVCYKTCTNVEDRCKNTFHEVGLSSLDCSHNYYQDCSKIAPPAPNTPSGPSSSPSSSSSSSLLWLWVTLVVVFVLAVLLAAGLAYYFINKRQQETNALETDPLFNN